MELRHYQIKAKEELRAKFAQGEKRVILCKPTGSGKTAVFSDLTNEAFIKGKSVGIICNRKELIKQAAKKLSEYGIFPKIIMGGAKSPESSVYVASIDTLRNRDLPKTDLLIIDEAHIKSFDPTIKRFIDEQDPYIIGATATPKRYGSSSPLSDIYQSIVCPTTILELLKDDYLVPAITYGASTIDVSGIKMKGGDFDEASMFLAYDKPVLYDGVVENYMKFTPNQKAIVFNVNIEHSKKMNDKFLERGIKSVHIDGNTSDFDREFALSQFKSGEIMVLNNCSIFTTGFDEPSIEVIIVNRSTMSLILWLQMCGRGSRPFKRKSHFTIIDQGSNVTRHGFWEDDREWTLFEPKKKNVESIAPIKSCPSCEALISASTYLCKYCGHEIPRKEAEVKLSDFQILSNKLPDHLKSRNFMSFSIEELIQFQELAGYKINWIPYQLSKNPSFSINIEESLNRVAELKGYKKNWVKITLEHLNLS